MKIFITLVLLACWVVGCTSRMVWYQEGKSPEERDRDIRDCKQQAMPYGYSWSKSDPHASSVSEERFGPARKHQPLLDEDPHRRSDKFRACMEEKGYRVEDPRRAQERAGAKGGQPSQ